MATESVGPVRGNEDFDDPKVKYLTTDAFGQLVGEAVLMLSHSMRQGLNVSTADIGIVIETSDLLSEGKAVSSSAKVQFLETYERLARLVKPATVSSLSAVLGDGSKRRGRTAADREVRRYTALAILTFSLLAVIQVFWIVGGGLVRNLTDARSQFDSASVQFAPYLPGTRALAPGEVPHRLPSDEEAKMERLGQQVSNSLSVVRSYDSALVAWNNMASAPLKLLWPLHRGLQANAAVERRVIEYQFVIGSEEQQRITTDTTTANFAVQALQTFALPFLYGLLGASIYILRRLSNEIHQLTYEPINDYRLRIPMGALAGVAIGWVFNVQDGSSLTKSLPGFALAFLAGYSVEFLFSTLDKLVGAFSKEKGVKG